MKNVSLIKLIIVCITAIVCISIASYTYYESNRYEVSGQGGSILIDKYNGISYDYEGKVDNYFRNKP